MTALLALLFATTFPSLSRTAWMRPDAFHLTIGMPRAEAIETLRSNGLKTQPAKKEHELVVDYTDDKSLTLQFEDDRLHAIRSELFAIVGQTKDAFAEEKKFLAHAYGAPSRATKSLIVYDDRLPNVIVILNDDPKSESGQKGVAMLVVRYYDPR